MKITDPCERIVAEALERAGIPFVHESDDKSQELDFYVHSLGVFIEVKQFSTPRTDRQLAGRNDVILLQGRPACFAFAEVLDRGRTLGASAQNVRETPTDTPYTDRQRPV